MCKVVDRFVNELLRGNSGLLFKGEVERLGSEMVLREPDE